MCDSIMEAVSVALSREYLDEFGTILHHNIDKGLLAAGRVKTAFGGGRVTKPMELIIGDRATFQVGRRKVPVAEIAVSAAQSWVREHLRFMDPERHVKYRVVLSPGSAELADIFARDGEVRAANDTSAAVGYYPLSPTEQAVLEFEQYLNSRRFKDKFPDSGEDVKVMGLREGHNLQLTVAMPLLAERIASESAYFERKAAMHRAMDRLVQRFEAFRRVSIHFNALDEPGRGLGGVYLSVLGTSAEDADSGQVGRGNRVNGVIALNRPLGTEAAAGKNPVSHVGKIYNVLAHQLAREIYESVDGVSEAHVLLLSRIGSPVDRPAMAGAQLLMEKGCHIREIKPQIQQIFEERFAELGRFCAELARGRYPVC